jgi:choline dehydrogenase-like flavoprotein
VLAAGAIENARLLLASSEANPRGLGNEHDLVGRFFMEHPHIRSGVIRPRDPDLLSQLGLYQRHRAGEENVAIHAKLAVDPAVLRERGLLNTTYFVEPMSDSRASAATRSAIALKHAATFRPLPPDIARHLATVVTNAGAIASTAREVLTKKRTRDVAQLMCMAEDAPNPDSRVTLGSRADSTGLPVARLDWRPSEAVRRSVRAAQDLLDEQLRDARLGRVDDKLGDEDPPREIKGAWHHMGTARMDPDPTRGVVDEHCRVHSVDNLYVAGSAVFPTVGYANPTLTIVALALRLADHLKARLGRPLQG